LAILERDLIFEENGRCYIESGSPATGFDKVYLKTGLSDGIQIEVLEGVTPQTSIKVQGTAL
jgi:hypothetical protein